MSIIESPSEANADERNAIPHPWLYQLTPAQQSELTTGTYQPYRWARELSHLSDTEFALAMVDPALPGLHIKLSKLTPDEVRAAWQDECAKVKQQREWFRKADNERFERDYKREAERRAALGCDDEWRAPWEAEKAERAAQAARKPIQWPLLPTEIFDEEEEARAILATKNLYAVTRDGFGSTWCLGTEDAEKALQEMNGRFAVVKNYGGKARVVWDEPDTMLNRMVHAKQSFSEFKNAYCNREVLIGFKKNAAGDMVPVKEKVGDWWLKHPLRRQYERLSFAPGRTATDGELNLWAGWAVRATKGAMHESFLEHVRGIICAGNEEHYAYLVKWMARAVQQPGVPGEVAVVVRSIEEGTGKGFFAKNFGKLFGRHYLQISNAAHLTGQFNAHLRTVILLFADEAFFASDRKHASTLKTLITEPHLAIEAKNVDVEASPNCVHLIMASNDPHVVPADDTARRFFVLNVSPIAVGDREYFAGIASDLETGGYEDLLGYLQSINLKGWNVLDVPETDALMEQKALTVQDGWLDILREALPDHDCRVRGPNILDFLGVPRERQDRKCLMRLASVMRALDFESKDARFGGKVLKGYVRGTGVKEVHLPNPVKVPF